MEDSIMDDRQVSPPNADCHSDVSSELSDPPLDFSDMEESTPTPVTEAAAQTSVKESEPLKQTPHEIPQTPPSQPEPQTEPQAKPDPQPQAVPDLGPQATPHSEPQAKPDCEPQADSDPEPRAKSEPDTQPQTEPQMAIQATPVGKAMPAPQNLDGAISDDEFVPTTRPKRRVAPTPASSRPKRAKKDPWAPEHVMQNPKSPLATIDLRTLFTFPATWDILSASEQSELLSLLPPTPSTATPITRPSPTFLKYDEDFRHCLTLFQEDISEGRYDHEWLEQAIAAHQKRKAGVFDSFKAKEFEEFWGQKQKLQYDVVAGESSSVRLEELVGEGVCRPGDVWVFERRLLKKEEGKGKGVTVRVGKEITFLGETSKQPWRAKFSYPPGSYEISSTHLRPDIVKDDVTSPQALSNLVIQESGLWEGKIPDANAWKQIRVRRDEMDLGTLWDMRQAYWLGKGEKGEVKEEVKMKNGRKKRKA